MFLYPLGTEKADLKLVWERYGSERTFLKFHQDPDFPYREGALGHESIKVLHQVPIPAGLSAIRNSTGSSKTPPPLLFGGAVLFSEEQGNHQALVYPYLRRPSDRAPRISHPYETDRSIGPRGSSTNPHS